MLSRASPVWLVIIVLELVKEESARILVVHMHGYICAHYLALLPDPCIQHPVAPLPLKVAGVLEGGRVASQ